MELPDGWWVERDNPTALGKYTGDEEDVVIPEGITMIGPSTFREISVTSVSIPSSVITILFSNFQQCIILADINVSPDNVNYSSVDGVLFNKDKTELLKYPQGKTASTYTIPSSVKTIGGGAFYGCTSLKSIYIPASVTEFGRVEYGTAFERTTTFKVIEGSYAHQWAIENEQPYTLFSVSSAESMQDVFDILTIIVNDLSGDSKLTAVDVPVAMKYVVSL